MSAFGQKADVCSVKTSRLRGGLLVSALSAPDGLVEFARHFGCMEEERFHELRDSRLGSRPRRLFAIVEHDLPSGAATTQERGFFSARRPAYAVSSPTSSKIGIAIRARMRRVVPPEGLEPPRPKGQQILSVPRSVLKL